jgi:UDP-N-acetylglucosamine/UDP-N-acetylgalactosamine diphosphorylase
VPDEKVGVICKIDNIFQVIEYSELSEVARQKREKNGDLTYNAGNICNHYIHVDFLAEICK